MPGSATYIELQVTTNYSFLRGTSNVEELFAASQALGIVEGDRVRLGNARGEVSLAARPGLATQRGVLVVEGIWLNEAFADGMGINQLIGADPVPPNGGCAFHDTAVWLRRDDAVTAPTDNGA